MAAPVGNKFAAKAKIWEQAIKRALARKSNDSIDKGLDTLADRLVEAAEKGDQWALREIGDRLDGKPAQAIVGDDELPPIRIQKVERVLVRADAADRDG
jgi:hypothetical protein